MRGLIDQTKDGFKPGRNGNKVYHLEETFCGLFNTVRVLGFNQCVLVTMEVG